MIDNIIGTFPELPNPPKPKYTLSKDAVLETFDDGGLVLILPERRLMELNQSAVKIIQLLDGERSSEQVAVEIAKNHDISASSERQIVQDVLDLCNELYRNGVLERNRDFRRK